MQFNHAMKVIGAGWMVLAAEAGAWCPGTNGDTRAINCSNCTVELSCNYSGAVYINGDRVQLNGNGYTLSGSAGNGITVNGDDAVITDLIIDGAGIDCIQYFNDGGEATLNNVLLNSCERNGVTNTRNNLSVLYSAATQNGLAGVASWGHGTDYADLYQSEFTHNTEYGSRNGDLTHSFFTGNWHYNNGVDGAYDEKSSGGYFYDNDFVDNGRHGLFLKDRNESAVNLEYNNGSGNNTGLDCNHENVNSIDAFANYWADLVSTCFNYP